jgi:hypothetical protein
VEEGVDGCKLPFFFYFVVIVGWGGADGDVGGERVG